jgi:uncharacterized membrane protein
VSYDEITTKIEIPTPTPKPESNIVRIDFTNAERKRDSRQRPPAATKAAALATEPAKRSWFGKIKDLDLGSPWVIRLVAVALILGLSMLVL